MTGSDKTQGLAGRRLLLCVGGGIAAYKAAEPIMHRYSSRGLIHKNKAARHKSRLTPHIKAI